MSDAQGYGSMLLSTSAVAGVFGVSPRSMARWTAQGVLVPDVITPTGTPRWSVASLHRQFDALRAPGDPAPPGSASRVGSAPPGRCVACGKPRDHG